MPTPFEKGDKRINRKGRPKKGSALTDILNYKLDIKDEAGKLDREVIAEKLIEAAKKGDIVAVKYIFDRLEGRPVQAVELDAQIDNYDRQMRESTKLLPLEEIERLVEKESGN